MRFTETGNPGLPEVGRRRPLRACMYSYTLYLYSKVETGIMANIDQSVVRKNYRLHQSKIDRAREILGTATETETIERALDLVAFGEELRAGVDAMRGTNLDNIFGEGED